VLVLAVVVTVGQPRNRGIQAPPFHVQSPRELGGKVVSGGLGVPFGHPSFLNWVSLFLFRFRLLCSARSGSVLVRVRVRVLVLVSESVAVSSS
jgi:hypothetical protein